MKKSFIQCTLIAFSVLASQHGGALAQPRANKADPAKPSLEALQHRARAGDAEARNALGNIYLTGEGDPRGPQVESAIACLYLAAQQGHADARDELAKLSKEMPAYTRSIITSMKSRVDNFMTQGEWARPKGPTCE